MFIFKAIFAQKLRICLSLSLLFSLGLAWVFDLKAKEVTSTLPQLVLQKLEKFKSVKLNEARAENKPVFSQEGQFLVGYIPVKKKNYKLIEQLVVESKIFDIVAKVLNEAFVLPSDIHIVLSECGEVNSFYSYEHKTIIMCYELIEDFAHFSSQYTKNSEEWFKSTLGGTMYVFVHELGHALIDVLDLPIVGKEEDAVDQLAVIIASEAGEFGERMAMVPASQYLLRSSQTEVTNVAYGDEHSLDIQRYYQIVCLFYGSNPSKYENIASIAQLSSDRMQKCPTEYQKVYKNWARLLQPHLKQATPDLGTGNRE